MRNTTAHMIEICNCWVPSGLKALGGSEVNFLPQKSSQRTHLRTEASGKRPKEGGREGEVFSGAQKLGVFRSHFRSPNGGRVCALV